jgi:hypothetical protein
MSPPRRQSRPRAAQAAPPRAAATGIQDERTLLQGSVQVVITRHPRTGTRAVELRCRRVERVTRIALFPHQLSTVLDALEDAEELLAASGGAGGVR